MRRGLSLIEVVMGLGLLALVLPLALDLVPSGLFAQRRAADIQAATDLAAGWLEESKTLATLRPGVDRDEDVSVGRARFHASREIYAVDQSLYDVVVRVSLARGEPVRLATRLAR